VITSFAIRFLPQYKAAIKQVVNDARKLPYNCPWKGTMRNTYDEQPDLDLVSAFIAGRRLSAERFSQVEIQAGKTPDFRVRQAGEVLAYCEVKSPNDPWLDELLDDAPPLTLVGGARPDPYV
jgi:hypothetical protein